MTTNTAPVKITIDALIHAPVHKVWDYWNQPVHIMQWAFASDDWHAPQASNDIRTGGTFSTTMAAKDGSMSFTFGGVYNHVQHNEYIEYTLDDGRKVITVFLPKGEDTQVVQTFEAETENPLDMQQGGWQAILNNFKKHTEANR